MSDYFSLKKLGTDNYFACKYYFTVFLESVSNQLSGVDAWCHAETDLQERSTSNNDLNIKTWTNEAYILVYNYTCYKMILELERVEDVLNLFLF